MKAKVTLKYKDKLHTFTDEEDDGKDEVYEGSVYMWTEGNFSCDCNRSRMIKEYCDDGFPEMDCGEEIQLVNLEFVK